MKQEDLAKELEKRLAKYVGGLPDIQAITRDVDEAVEELTRGEYNPVTCITAGELRDAGAVFDESIPDCAWVPRSSLKLGKVMTKTVDESTRQVSAGFTLEATEPFHWISVNGTIKV